MYQWDEVRVGCEKTECRQLRGGREKAGERLRSKGSFFFFLHRKEFKCSWPRAGRRKKTEKTGDGRGNS